MDSKTMTLTDGRKLGYAEYGRSDGVPVLYFHESPSCRISATTSLAHEILQSDDELRVRLIAVERPGYGLSDEVETYSLGAWVDDVVQFADWLGIGRFGVLGAAGGGPFALACAHALPHRVTKIAIQGGMGPLDAPDLVEALSPAMQHICVAAVHAPEQIEAFVAHLCANVETFVRMQFAELTARDQQVATDALLQVTVESLREATRSASGYLSDFQLITKPWQVNLGEIRVPVKLWYSDRDQSVPISHGEYLSRTIPGATLHRLSGYAHLPAALSCISEVLTYLAS